MTREFVCWDVEYNSSLLLLRTIDLHLGIVKNGTPFLKNFLFRLMGRQNVALFVPCPVVGLPIPIRDQLAIPSSHTHKRRHCPLLSPRVFLAMRNAPFDSLAGPIL